MERGAAVSRDVDDKMLRELKASIMNRARLYYYIFEETKKTCGEEKAIDIFKRGIYQRGLEISQSYPPEAREGNIQSLADHFVNESAGGGEIFEPAKVEVKGSGCILRMNSCPLVEAWEEMGLSSEEIAILCDMASAIDYGTFEGMGYDLEFTHQIGRGESYCELVISKGA